MLADHRPTLAASSLGNAFIGFMSLSIYAPVINEMTELTGVIRSDSSGRLPR
jgi:hypothetical protein